MSVVLLLGAGGASCTDESLRDRMAEMEPNKDGTIMLEEVDRGCCQCL